MTSMSRIITGPDTARCDDAASIRVQLAGGSLEVLPRDEPGVWVEVTELAGQPLEVATEADRVTIGYPTIGWEGWVKRLATTDTADRASIRIYVGAGVTTSAATVSAPVVATGITGDLDIATASGPTRVERSTGSIKVRTASGPVTVEAHHGPVSVAGASGPIRLDGELPRASVTSVAGAVTIRHQGASAVLNATTVSGAIAVRLPSDTHLELEVRGVAARVSVDGAAKGGGLGVVRAQEPGSGQRVMVTATTVNGAVAVERVDPHVLPGSEEPPA